MFQSGKPLPSLDAASLRLGDITDSLGHVIYRATPRGWVFCGRHLPVVEPVRVPGGGW